jgi:MOSC domain-containing protein YiiM
MKLLSLNIGLPRDIVWHGVTITTGIFKQPVAGRVPLRTLNLDGDRQADLTVHGGPYKAVYLYPIAHYDYWQRELPGRDLPGRDLPPATFGENFTADSPLEDAIHIGDRFGVGSAELVVTQPRLPCYKLAAKFQADDMVKRFLASGRTGYYLMVTQEGEVAAGDEITPLARDPNGVPVSEITRLYIAKRFSAEDAATVRRTLEVEALPQSWKSYFEDRLQRAGM